MKRLLLLGLLLLAPLARAATPDQLATIESQFQKLKQGQITTTQAAQQAQAVKVDQAAQTVIARNSSVETPALSGGNGLTSLQKLSAFVGASSDADVDAGVTANPFALAGAKLAQGVSVSLASLTDDSTKDGTASKKAARLGAGWAFVLNEEALKQAVAPAAIELPTTWSTDLDSLKGAFTAFCATAIADGALTAADYPEAGPARVLAGAQLACQGTSANPDLTVSNLLQAFTNFKVLLAKLPTARLPGLAVADFQNRITPLVTTAYQALDALDQKLLHPTDDELRAFRENNSTDKFAVGFHVDLFPVIWGFQGPATHKLTDKALSLDLAFTHQTQRLEWGVGLSLAGTKDSRDATDYQGQVSPRVNLTYVLKFFNEPDEAIGADTPRIAAGLDASVDLTPNKAAIQRHVIAGVKVVPHLDMVLSDKLSLRLGIPVTAKQLSQDASADGKTPAVKDLQWSVPATIATVLKL